MKISTAKINFFTFMLVIVFSLYALINTGGIIDDNNQTNSQFDAMMDEIEDFNNSISQDNNDGTTTTDNTEILFSSATEAIDSSYEVFTDAESYYSETTVNFVASAFLQSLNLDIYLTEAKYKNGDFLQEIIVDENSNMFDGVKAALLLFYQSSSNKVYQKFTFDVTKSGEEYSISYPSNWISLTLNDYISNNGSSPWTLAYNISSSYVISQDYFNSFPNDNGGNNYYAEVELNSTLSSANYFNYLKHIFSPIGSDILSSIEYDETTVSAAIDENGYPMAFNFNSEYQLNFNDLIINSANCTAEMNCMFSGINEDIAYEKPHISPFD